MDLIKLPMGLGLMVVEILKKQNIEPRCVENGKFKGMLSLEFSQEELNLIKELNITNPSSGCLDGIDKLIEQNELDIFELDFLHFDEVCDFLDKLNFSCHFIETIRSKNITIDYTQLQMLYFHKKCLEIAEEAKKNSQDERTQIIYVENYLAKNIVYDYDALKTKKRAHYENGAQRGKSYGTNSAYNGIMFGTAVCEGYTRTMQYILKLMGIKSKNVHCIGGANKISINESYHNQVSLPDDGYHSIIRIDSQNSIYYCDPCWDSCRLHRGDNTLPYCLLTKKEILKTHTLSFEEDDVIYDISYPRDYVSNVIEYLNEKEKSNLNETNNKKR